MEAAASGHAAHRAVASMSEAVSKMEEVASHVNESIRDQVRPPMMHSLAALIIRREAHSVHSQNRRCEHAAGTHSGRFEMTATLAAVQERADRLFEVQEELKGLGSRTLMDYERRVLR